MNKRREELLIWLADVPCIEAIADNWLCEVTQLEIEREWLIKWHRIWHMDGSIKRWAFLTKHKMKMPESLKKALGGE